MNTTKPAPAAGTAADYFIATTARIVETTGCTVDQAIDHLLAKMATERPELLAKVVAGVL